METVQSQIRLLLSQSTKYFKIQLHKKQNLGKEKYGVKTFKVIVKIIVFSIAMLQLAMYLPFSRKYLPMVGREVLPFLGEDLNVLTHYDLCVKILQAGRIGLTQIRA